MSVNVERTIKNLEKNNIEVIFVNGREDVVPAVQEILNDGATVSVGGSVTLDETGVLEHLRCGRYDFLDRYKDGLNAEQIGDIYRSSFGVDAYFCSSNAITEDGELYNVDGNANRIAAIAFGPKNVIIVAGINKIVKNIDEAVRRVKSVSAPKNAVRLCRNTYCAVKGCCVDMDGGMGKGCDSDGRMCRHYLVSSKQAQFGRIKVILVNEELGY